MAAVMTTSGQIAYTDVGDGPTIVFVHGVLVSGTLWRKVVPQLPSYRCLCPTLPLGAHSPAFAPGADLSPRGVAALLREFLDALDLREVTLVANDTGGAITQLLLADGCDRVARVVFTPCDSFDNFLPRSLRPLQYVPRVPGALAALVAPLRFTPLRRIALRWLSIRPVPADVSAQWLHPLITDRAVRRDANTFLRGIDHRDTVAAAAALEGYEKPVLLLWPARLPYFPFAHAERWAAIVADATVVEVPDSYTFVAEDQPEFVAERIAEFVAARVT